MSENGGISKLKKLEKLDFGCTCYLPILLKNSAFLSFETTHKESKTNFLKTLLFAFYSRRPKFPKSTCPFIAKHIPHENLILQEGYKQASHKQMIHVFSSFKHKVHHWGKGTPLVFSFEP